MPSPLDVAEHLRLTLSPRLDPSRRKQLGQYLTQFPVARLLASLLDGAKAHVSILDAGAGSGALFAAAVEALTEREKPPQRLSVVAYELDPVLADATKETLQACAAWCAARQVDFVGEVRREDFLVAAEGLVGESLLAFETPTRFDVAILNPPYRKITSSSRERRLLSSLGIEATNLYTGFLSVAARLLAEGGELVAITPRSFCNGRYFEPFRKDFFRRLALQRLHVFETRTDAFKDDAVLQETIVLRAIRSSERPATVAVTTSVHADDAFLWRDTPYTEIIRPDDPEHVVYVLADEGARDTAARIEALPATLDDLGVSVSTGRVVHFRCEESLLDEAEHGAAPLLWPHHLNSAEGSPASGFVAWPRSGSRKPEALAVNEDTKSLLVPLGDYVLVKRFSAKEQARRISLAVLDPTRLPPEAAVGLGIENHLNYLHARGKGLDPKLARGLAVYLGSSLVDDYFRLSSGHTQVNASDLKRLRFPSHEALEAIGQAVNGCLPDPDTANALLDVYLPPSRSRLSRTGMHQRLSEALAILKSLGFPKAQLNDRSGLTLLALGGIEPEDSWRALEAPPRGVTPIMEFIAQHYGKTYKPNTRETVRRQTLHQFVEAGLALLNADDPGRATNSPHNVYSLSPEASELLRTYGTSEWEARLAQYLKEAGSLKQRYAYARTVSRIPVRVSENVTVSLSPGGQNVLIKAVVEEFAAQFTPGAQLLYLGDTGAKHGFHDAETLAALGVVLDAHGKMPDVVLFDGARNWLVLVEAVTSHGPVDPKRHSELRQLFAPSSAGLVFVTAFLTREAFKAYAGEIAWETEVWIAEAPSHLVHFNGERFLGPHAQR